MHDVCRLTIMFVNVLMLIKLELVASLYNINKYTQKKMYA